jgi:hypothetical protein
MTVLSSGLETIDYNAPGWNHIYNQNIDLLTDQLLKLAALQDVDVSDIDDGRPFTWNDSTNKWEPAEL